jgi:hypothetical protein
MLLHCAVADPQPAADASVGTTFRNQGGHLTLAGAEPCEPVVASPRRTAITPETLPTRRTWPAAALPDGRPGCS